MFWLSSGFVLWELMPGIIDLFSRICVLSGQIPIRIGSFQKSEWKLHRNECKALSRLDKEKRKLVTPTIRLMVKLYLKRNLQNEKVISLVFISCC